MNNPGYGGVDLLRRFLSRIGFKDGIARQLQPDISMLVGRGHFYFGLTGHHAFAARQHAAAEDNLKRGHFHFGRKRTFLLWP